MPNDLYQWEKCGGLSHHCPTCETPLSNPSAKNTCLGIHVECCPRYHTQLFRKGTSSQCYPCSNEDKEQAKRHRKIAELIRDSKAIKEAENPQDSPSTDKAKDVEAGTSDNKEAAPATKKQPKYTKKGKPILAKPPKAVTTADVDFVTTVLRPDGVGEEDGDVERRLLQDADMNTNLSYHAGTSNRREIRMGLIKKDKASRGQKGESVIDSKAIDGYLQILDVTPLTKGSSGEEKQVYNELKGAIRADLQQATHEREQMLIRKAGFFRWASKKAHQRLEENRRVSDSKGYDSQSTTNSNPSEDVGEANEEIDSTEFETDATTSSEIDEEEGGVSLALDGLKLIDSEKSPTNGPKTSTPGPATKENGDEDGGWTTVGNPGKIKKTPVGKLTLVHNGGLEKLASPVTKGRKRSGFSVLDH